MMHMTPNPSRWVTTAAPDAGMQAATESAAPLLEIKDLSKRFGGVQALSGLSLDVNRGEIASIIGPNGAGKTTIFNLVCRLYQPTGGSIRLGGDDLLSLRPHDLAGRGIGRTFQNLALFRHGTVVDNLLVGLHTHLGAGVVGGAWFMGGVSREEIRAREEVEDIIEFLEMEQIRDIPVHALSYGLRKRVELGRALATRPRLLLLDEMVSGMNQEETEDIARFILDLRDEKKMSVLMIEHDMGIVMDISDKVHVLDFGVPIASGTPAEIAPNPRVVEAYLGVPR
jgi:branched-chain amino acid transport system ATP-binding protein